MQNIQASEAANPIVAALTSASRSTGADFDYLLSTAMRESSLKPQAKSKTSSASGLFQFIPGTWGWASPNAGYAGASPFEPEANVATAAWLVQTSIDQGKDAWVHWTCKP